MNEHLDNLTRALSAGKTTAASLLEKSTRAWTKGLEAYADSWRFAAYNGQSWLRGHVFPAFDSAVQMNRAVADSLGKVVNGESDWTCFALETRDRMVSASRYAYLVNTLGKACFRSARFEGEEVIAENAIFKLSYLPPKQGVEPQALPLFHAGGSIPYGDGIFRLTPEYNLYGRFLERGIPVYAMESRGDRFESDYSGMTMEALIDSVAELSDAAFEHAGGRRMALEGYCGHGTQLLAYLAAKPEDAARKFRAFLTMVSPIDGRRCPDLAESVKASPKGFLQQQMKL